MRRGSVVILICVLPLVACGPTPEQRVTTEARDAMKKRLIDPGSARFRNLYIVQGRMSERPDIPDRRVVCGEVSAKNRGGVYVGFTPFSWSNPDGVLGFDALRDQRCRT